MVSEANGKKITFEYCAFSPHRERLAQKLTEYLKLQENGYVLNVDGEWGSGKTFFLKAWEEMLKDSHPTCFIDAWTLDYLNDPLATLSRKILNAMHEHLKSVGLLDPSLEKKVFKGLYKVLSTSANIVGGIVENTATPAAGKAIQFGIKKLDDKLLKSGKDQYELFKKSEDALSQFRTTLQQYIHHAIEKSPDTSPFFIFIDELDRCRPNYAIELLESVKHLFCLKNTVFVVATNRSEMEKSIQKVYGSDFRSDNYLSRFFDRSISIRSTPKPNFLSRNKNFKIILEKLHDTCFDRKPFSFIQFLSSSFSEHNIELREIEKILDQIVLSLPDLENKIFSLYCLSYLFILKFNYRYHFHELRPSKEEFPLSLNHSLEESRFSNKNIPAPSGNLKLRGCQYSLSDLLCIEFKYQSGLYLVAEKNNSKTLDSYFQHNDRQKHQPETRHKEAIVEISKFLTEDTHRSDELVSLIELFDIVEHSSILE